MKTLAESHPAGTRIHLCVTPGRATWFRLDPTPPIESITYSSGFCLLNLSRISSTPPTHLQVQVTSSVVAIPPTASTRPSAQVGMPYPC